MAARSPEIVHVVIDKAQSAQARARQRRAALTRRERTRTFLTARRVTYLGERSAFYLLVVGKRVERFRILLRNPACSALLYYYLWARYLCDWMVLTESFGSHRVRLGTETNSIVSIGGVARPRPSRDWDGRRPIPISTARVRTSKTRSTRGPGPSLVAWRRIPIQYHPSLIPGVVIAVLPTVFQSGLSRTERENEGGPLSGGCFVRGLGWPSSIAEHAPRRPSRSSSTGRVNRCGPRKCARR